MPSLDFLPATQNDQKPLKEFLLSIFGQSYQKLLDDYLTSSFSDAFRRPFFVIGKSGKSIVAAAAISEELFTTNVWGLSWVAVHPENQNKGIGQDLCHFCLTYISNMAQQDITAIVLTYPDKTTLYDRLGFTKGSHDHLGGLFMTKKVPYHG